MWTTKNDGLFHMQQGWDSFEFMVSVKFDFIWCGLLNCLALEIVTLASRPKSFRAYAASVSVDKVSSWFCNTEAEKSGENGTNPLRVSILKIDYQSVRLLDFYNMMHSVRLVTLRTSPRCHWKAEGTLIRMSRLMSMWVRIEQWMWVRNE